MLEARVRTELGRAVSHPAAIDVYVEDARVILTGAVLESELEQLLDRVRKVPGVSEVDNQLRIYAAAEGVPALQGDPHWPARFALQQENWAPAVRALTAGAGTAVLIWALRRRDLAAGLIGVGALSLLARGATNIPLRRLTGVGAGRRAVDVQKSITINAPPARVFAFLTEWEEWPRWMSHVREVRAEGSRGEGEGTHWVVDGPLGVPVAWDAVTTRLVPNEEIAWKTVPGAAVQHAGTIRLVAVDAGTRVEVHMSYNPPGGAVGHAVAASVGRDSRPLPRRPSGSGRSCEPARTGADGRERGTCCMEPAHAVNAAARRRGRGTEIHAFEWRGIWNPLGDRPRKNLA